jgi:hypothetical protein
MLESFKFLPQISRLEQIKSFTNLLICGYFYFGYLKPIVFNNK